MAEERIRKFIEAMLRESAVSNEHDRLQADLNEWAQSRQYPTTYSSLPSGREPDVLRYHTESKMLFIGDAKNAENETPSNSETVRRISGYIQEFADLLKGPSVRGGIIAIATNDANAAQEWATTLKVLCVRACITGSTANSPPAFTVNKIQNKNTWITWW